MSSNGNQHEVTGPRRMPGKYIAIGLVILTVLFFSFTLALSISLTPAADRFHNPTTTKP